MSEERQSAIDFHRNYCVHYQPREAQCGAGVSNEDRPRVPAGPQGIKWGPCIEGHTLEDPTSVCPHWERRSLESAEVYADAMDRALQQMMVAQPFIAKWRSKPPIGKSETVECPVCGGRLRLSQSAYNGHVGASCETENCVSFIE